MRNSVVIKRLPQAFRVIKEMNVSTDQWDSEYRVVGPGAVAQILEQRMRDRVSWHLEQMPRVAEADRQNGSFSRHLLTELGDIELHIPRTRRFSPISVLRAYARRAPQIDQLIVACFVLGIATRKVAHALLPILGEPLSATTVSRVARTLDTALAAFHRRPVRRQYRFLLLDGVLLKRKTGAGAVKRAVVLTLGMTPEGKREVIDCFIAQAESQGAGESFLNDLYRRGLDGEGLELISADGGKGLIAAVPLIYPRVPLQRCWVHKTRTVLNSVRTGRIMLQ